MCNCKAFALFTPLLFLPLIIWGLQNIETEIAGGPTVEAQVVVASRLKRVTPTGDARPSRSKTVHTWNTKIFTPGYVSCNSTLWLFWIVLSPSLLVTEYFTKWIWSILQGEFPLHVFSRPLKKIYILVIYTHTEGIWMNEVYKYWYFLYVH